MSRRIFAGALLLMTACLGAFADQDPLTQIPDGYMDGRPDAKYGTYSSTMQESAKAYQERVLKLEKKVYGFPSIDTTRPAYASELAYVLEHEVIRLHREIGDAPKDAMTDFERRALLFSTARMYSVVRNVGERLYENMIRFIDLKLPGPNGVQIRSEVAGELRSVYEPNYRSDENLNAAQRKQLYDKRVAGFLAEGGSFSEIDILRPETLNQYSRFEYVWMESGEVKVTAGNAGHILLAGGNSVRSAGQIVLLKNLAGEFTMMIVTNASGSFKPDLLSAQQLATQLQQQLKVPSELVVVTKGEPLSAQAVKIYMKGEGVDPAFIKLKVKVLESIGKDILFRGPVAAPSCGGAFSQAS